MLLSIDTLRADHLGCYGHARATSPNLDRLAASSLRFENAYAPAPWTLPSHVAMLTGRHPYEIGIEGSRHVIPSTVVPIGERLAAAGYQSAAFVDSSPLGFVGAKRGFGRGFDVYRHSPHRRGSSAGYLYDMAATVDAAVEWLRGRDPARPFLLFLHTKSVHATPRGVGDFALTDAPYDKPTPYRTRFLPEAGLRYDWRSQDGARGVHYLQALNRRIAEGVSDPADFPSAKLEEAIALYDGGIYYVDEHFQRLLDALEELGVRDETVIIVTSDHGEAFLDHEFFLHLEVHAPVLRVPLILHDPRRPVARVATEPVSLTDIVPTILELAGIPAQLGPAGPAGPAAPTGQGGPAGPTGRSLVTPQAADAPTRPFFSYARFQNSAGYQGYALQRGRFKLVYEKTSADPAFRSELYDIQSDPNEARPLERPKLERALMTRLLRRIDARSPHESPQIDLGPETTERLRALGYLE